MSQEPTGPDPATELRTGPDPATELQSGAVTLPGIVMQAATHIAPAVGMIFAVPVLTGLAGVVSPLVFLAGGLMMLLVAVSVIELAKRLSSAGGYFTWVSRTLGTRAGFLTAWLFFLYSPLAAGINLAFMGGILEPTLKAEYGFTLSWWIPAIAGVVLVTALQYYGVKISVRTMVGFGLVEVLLCVGLAVTGLLDPGPGGVNLHSFQPGEALSVNGFYLAVVYSVFTFSGFESVAPLAEEASEPRRTLPAAVIISLLAAIVFFVFVPWGILVGWGTDNLNGFIGNESPVFALAHRLWGGAWVLILLAYVNSALAVSLAGSNAGTRVFYAMARAGALPAWLTRIHPEHHTPVNAIWLEGAVTLALVVIGGIVLGPVETLSYVAIPLTLAAILIYCAGNLASWRLYRTEYRRHFNWFLHVVCPILSSVALLWVGYKTVSPLPSGTTHSAPFVFAGWLICGVVLTFVAGRLGGDAWLARAGRATVEEEQIFDDTLGIGTPIDAATAEESST